MHLTRRSFLVGTGAISAASLMPGLGMINSRAQAVDDYKALVCVFLYGGNDGNNTIIPLTGAEYAAYSAVREPGGVAIAQSNVVPLDQASGTRLGLHPSLAPLQSIWNSNAMALMLNAGPLIRPMTRAEYLARAPRPDNLFSHDDQARQWQSGTYSGVIDFGMGGRISDRMSGMNTGSSVPMNMTTADNDVFLIGQNTAPFGVPTYGTFGVQGFGNNRAQHPRFLAMQALQATDRSNLIVKAAQDSISGAIAASSILNGVVNNNASVVAPHFSRINNSLARQLFIVAKLIEGRAQTGLKRQVFFVAQGGYDTHSDQLNDHANRLSELGVALKAFYDATVTLNVASKVTSFTMSDFGRTLKPNDGGTDHAWGNHHLVIGAGVRGGQSYGALPTLQLGGPSDSGGEGRWIPTTSVDQYAGALARWFGVPDADLPAMFPQLANFGGVAGLPALMA